MKKTRELSVRGRMKNTIIVMMIILGLVSVVMVVAGIQFARFREQAQMKLKMNALAALVANENEMLESAEESFDAHLSDYMRAVATLLGTFVTDAGYTGPRVLSDGFVAEIRDGDVLLPEGLPAGRMDITRPLIARSIASGKMRTGSFQSDVPLPQTGFMKGAADYDDGDGEGLSTHFYLSFMPIAEGLVYVDMTSEAEFEEDMSRYITINYTDLESKNGGFGGITLVIGERADEVKLLRSYGEKGILTDLSQAGFTAEKVRDRVPVLSVGGRTYSCTYSNLRGEWDGWQNPIMVQMLPVETIGYQSVIHSLLILYAMALILSNMVVYVLAVQRHVRENVVTEEQATRYAPKKLRGRMLNAGAIGAAAIFFMAFVVQGVGQLYTELKYGRDTLRLFARQLEQVDEQRNDAMVKLQEDWYVFYGEQLAALMSAYPELTEPDLLQACCYIMDIDYIMLFDSQGYETQCSRDYVGFTMDRGLGQDSSDFRRLLYGAPSIVHEVATDSITGLERQMIGVKLPSPGGSSRHGALIMALLPEQTTRLADLYRIDSQLSVLAVDGMLCFTADIETGEIRHANYAAMVGRNVGDYGLSDKSLQSGYMDFEVVDSNRYFIVTEKYGDSIFYYAINSGAMFDHVFVFAAIATGLFLLAAVVIMLTVFRGYDDPLFAKWAVIRLPGESEEEIRARQAQPRGEAGDDGLRLPGFIRAGLQKLAAAVKWEEKLPEEKVNLVFKVSFLVLLISWANLMLSKNVAYNKFGSLAGFLLQGDWMRGANMFAFCSIGLVVAYAYLVNVVSRAVLLVASGFLMGKGQTFCRLLHSFIKYFSMFVVLYLVLHYLGFPIGTVVGSLSITTLALSLGAKDLAADILAGLSIVFERTFQVGDIIEINGTRGRVQEIGVRTTKIVVPVNNVLIISNHQIQDVVNLTMALSRHTLELKVLTSEPLERLEAVLRRALPEIQRRNEKIIELVYMGVTDMGSSTGLPRTATMTLAIGATCQQGDVWDVRLYLNREIKLLCEREGIEMR